MMRYAYEHPDHYPENISDDDALQYLMKHLAIPAVWKIDKGRNRVILHLISRLPDVSPEAMNEARPWIEKAKAGIDGIG